MYTSRSPVPYCKKFNQKIGAKRIYGIFAFRYDFLKKFNSTSESFLEKIESCDTNRICESTGDLYEVEYPHQEIIAIDTIKDLKRVRNIYKKKRLKVL